MLNIRKVCIIATDQDGLNNRKLKDAAAIRQAITAAVKEFCQTEDGKKIYEGNCNNFNWGDLDAYLPETILNKYGLYKSDDTSKDILKVDFNEQLVSETDVFEEE